MDEAAICDIARAFAVCAERAVPLLGGYINDVWRTEPAPRHVVRMYGRLHVSRSAVRFEHDVMAHAAAKLAGIAPPLRDGAGATYRLIDGHFVAVLPYLEGETGACDRPAAAGAARLLAALHRALRDYHPGRGARAARSLGILPWLRERTVRLATDPLLARALPWDDVLTGCATATIGIAAVAGSLPVVVVHGDPHPDNFVSRAGAIAGLIDFDFAHETERVYDVATGVDNFGRPHEDAPLDLEGCAHFARAYDAAAPLAAAEWRVIPEMMIRRNAAIVWQIVSSHGRRAAGDVGNALRYVRRITEIVALAPQLRELGPDRGLQAAL